MTTEDDVREDDLDRALASYFAARPAAGTAPADETRPPDHVAVVDADAVGPAEFERRYTDFHEIGRGGMGQVLRAWDRQLAREVAVKVMLRPPASEPTRLRQFLTEARICARLQHPAILPVHDVGLARDGRPFIAMKLVHGTELGALLRASRDDRETVERHLRTFATIAQALAYAHARGIAHCDLKPSNVMVGRFGEVVVMDWGLAREFATDRPAAAQARSAALGTPAYCAPEQANGHVERCDARTDVFALGAILCEILTGEPPYPGAAVDALARARAADLQPIADRLRERRAPPDLQELTLACLQREPERRPRSADEVAMGVERHLAANAERARRAEIAAAEARVRARWTLSLSGVAIVLVLGGAFGWQAYRGERDARRRQVETAVREALQEARLLADRAGATPAEVLPWRRAADVAANAVALSRNADASADLTAAAADLHTSLRHELQQRERCDALRRRLLEARLGWWEERPHDGADEAGAAAAARDQVATSHRAAFVAFGVDIVALAHGVAVEELRGVADEVTAGLDYWAAAIAGEERLAADAEQLRQVLSALDTDPWRQRLRAAYATAAPDASELTALVTDGAASQQGPVHTLILATLMVRANRRADALALARNARTLRPGDFELAMWLGRFCSASADERGEAIAAFRAASALRPERTDAMHQLGIALSSAGELDAARATFERLVAMGPERGHWLGHLAEVNGRIAAARRDDALLATALEQARRALQLEPGPAQHLYCGVLLRARGELDEAAQHLREAASARSLGVRPWHELAMVHAQRRDADAEIAAMREALARAPDDPHVHCNLARLLSRAGQKEEAARLYRRAIEIAPAEPLFPHNLATVLFDLGRADEAIGVVRTALARDPRAPRLQRMLAELHSLAGDHAAAADVLERLVEGAVGDFIVFSNLANAYFELGRYREALTAADQAIRLAPQRPEPRRTRADAQRQLDDTRGALATLREAATAAPADALVCLDLLRSELENGEIEACVATRRRFDTEFAAAAATLSEEIAEVDDLLRTMLRGDVGTLDTTADATAGDLALAATAAQLRKDFGTAWSLWERALARPRLANAIAGEWEHSAATCALLAVRGPTATNEQRVRARGQARAWLQAFVDAESNALGGGSPRAHAALQRLMRSSDFESVRGEAALANLGAEEAAGWRAFWSTVAGIVRAEPTSSAEAEGRRD